MMIEPTAEHEAAMDDLKAALEKHKHLDGEIMLGLASQLVGNLIALQDQTKWTPGAVMAMVAANIEIGNQAAIEGLMKPEGSA